MAKAEKSASAETARLKYIGKKKSFKKVNVKGIEFELVNGVFEMPAQIAKAFLADGNSKSFKVEA